ncbi:MAG: DUF2283 domain-containing protein [Chloroflexi bacterium]|nr:DUF2283 domain-containing protein [Chloroflexota bacterium]
MRLTYDPEADVLAIVLREDLVLEDSGDLAEGVTALLDGEGRLIGLEVLDASERVGQEGLSRVAIERLSLTLSLPA